MQEDVMDCSYVLQHALCEDSLNEFNTTATPSAAARHAAYVLAVSIGRCRLFGVKLDAELDGALPLNIAAAAADELTRGVCQSLISGARMLPQQLDWAIAIEAEDMCADLLGGRFNAWAAEIALDEAYRAEDIETPAVKRFAGQLQSMAGELAIVDSEFIAVAIELTLAASGYLLENWREALAPEYREVAPWWLAGELERLSVELEKQEAEPWFTDEAWKVAVAACKEGKHLPPIYPLPPYPTAL